MLGMVPSVVQLDGVPVIESNPPASEGTDKPTIAVAKQASSLLLNSQTWDVLAKTARQWLGEGLGSIPKQVYDRVVKGEYVHMAEFRELSTSESFARESGTEQFVLLPGFEVSKVRKKPVTDVITWINFFSRFTVARAKHFPSGTPV